MIFTNITNLIYITIRSAFGDKKKLCLVVLKTLSNYSILKQLSNYSIVVANTTFIVIVIGFMFSRHARGSIRPLYASFSWVWVGGRETKKGTWRERRFEEGDLTVRWREAGREIEGGPFPVPSWVCQKY